MKSVTALLASLALLCTLAPAAFAGGPPAGALTVVANGLNNPRGLAIAPDGSIYVAEAGSGGAGPCVKGEGGASCFGLSGAVTRIQGGRWSRIVTGLPSVAGKDGSQATGPSDVQVGKDGTVDVTVQGVDSSSPVVFGARGAALWNLLQLTGNGAYRSVANLYKYEAANNPDGREINSDPYAVLFHGSGAVVADAAANDLLSVDAAGNVSTLAVFPARMVKGPGGKMIPMEAVPDSLAVGPDGAYYVGELTGFPFPVGGARIYRVVPGQKPTVYSSGFTNIIGLTFAPGGSLYVLEILKGGLGNVNPQNPATLSGALIRVAPDGTRTTVASQGLIAPAGLAISKSGAIYVSNFGILAGQGQVVRITP